MSQLQQTPPELREALIQFARDFNPNYFMTPCFNRKELSIEAAKRMLQVFVRRLCEHFFGKKYMQNPLIKDFNGVVFVEKPKKELQVERLKLACLLVLTISKAFQKMQEILFHFIKVKK